MDDKTNTTKSSEETNDFLDKEIEAAKEDGLHSDIGAAFIDQEPELEEINDSLAQQISSAIDEDSESNDLLMKKKKKKKRLIIGLSITFVLVGIIVAVLLLLFTKQGQKAVIKTVVAPNLYNGVFDYDDTHNKEEKPKEDKIEQKVINILLVGEEQIENAKNTDSMIVATLNRETNELSILSLMRDLYVEIPGHSSNKLNAAYSLGGIDLLEETIENNFGIQLDGYILVTFDTFETIIDLLGGVTVTLTANEASYLNRTNYISNPSNRNVVTGTQTLNGNQALGYCRVRYVSTGKEINDFGRTARQRAVLNAIFEKIKRKSVLELVSFMNKVFANVQLTTDISQNKFSDYLTEFVDLNINELNQYRIPADNGFYDDKVYIGSRKSSVLIPNDWEETRALVHKYIYGEEETTSDVNGEATTSPDEQGTENSVSSDLTNSNLN